MRPSKKINARVVQIISTILLSIGMLVVLAPLAWMMVSSLKPREAINTFPPQWIPRDQVKVTIDGKEYYLYDVPVDGVVRQLALVDKTGAIGKFVNPENPSKSYELPVASGTRVTQIKLHWENFLLAVTKVPFNHFGVWHHRYSCLLYTGRIWLCAFSFQGDAYPVPVIAFNHYAAASGYFDPDLYCF
jgi:ABC-type glycerol-3-phosphate transport system permease component